MKAIEDIAIAAEELAKRAQPHTVVSRLTLRDFQDVLTHMANGAHALGDGLEDNWAPALDSRFRSLGRQAGARVNLAAGYVDSAVAAMARDLRALHRVRSDDPDGQQSPGRRLAARAADQFAVRCEELRQGRSPRPSMMPDEQDASVVLARSICTMLGSAVNSVAFLVDAACERALGRTSGTLTPLVCARRELSHAQQRVQVLAAVSQS